MAKRKSADDKQIDYLETRYMYEERQSLYIANELTNQVYDETDIPDVIAAWNNNWSMTEISDYLGTDRQELELLLADLIHRGKIKGNIHIFKPKGKRQMKINVVGVGDYGSVIRTAEFNKQTWLCLKDLWKWLEKPDHSYRKVVEGWGPGQRAKFKLDTQGGRQDFIFININSLSKLCPRPNEKTKNKLEQLKEGMADGLGIQSGFEGITDAKQSKQKEKSGSRRISG